MEKKKKILRCCLFLVLFHFVSFYLRSRSMSKFRLCRVYCAIFIRFAIFEHYNIFEIRLYRQNPSSFWYVIGAHFLSLVAGAIQRRVFAESILRFQSFSFSTKLTFGSWDLSSVTLIAQHFINIIV